jgi:hypothetical protein
MAAASYGNPPAFYPTGQADASFLMFCWVGFESEITVLQFDSGLNGRILPNTHSGRISTVNDRGHPW